MVLTLQRVVSNEFGTFGKLFYYDSFMGDIPLCVTLEDPWNENQENISCIPVGEYTCKRHNSPRFGETFEVANVVNRSAILFHKGNTEADTKGCILVGSGVAYEKGLAVGIEGSTLAFNYFKEVTKDQSEFTLIIKSQKHIL